MQNRALTLTLTALTCVTAVLLCLAQSASGAVAPSLGKTASGDFFWQTEIHTQQIAVQPLQPQWEIGLATIPTASGRGGWLSADPIGEAGGLNLYGYVGGDPINAIDPLGLDVFVIYDEKSPTAGGGGHAAMITGQNGGAHMFQSFGAANGGCSSSSNSSNSSGSSDSSGSSRKAGPEIFEKSFSSRADALAYAKSQGYDKYNQWSSDLKQDRAAREAFRKQAKGYDVSANNCTDAARAGLDGAGVPNNRDSRIPNKHFDYNSDMGNDSGYFNH